MESQNIPTSDCAYTYVLLEYRTYVKHFFIFLIDVCVLTHEVLFRSDVLPLTVKGNAASSQEKDMDSKFGFWTVGS